MESYPTIGRSGQTLGYYSDLSAYLTISLAVVLVLAIAYNILLGFAVKWMNTHAWEKHKDNSTAKPQSPDTIWEELFDANIKIANFLMGSQISLIEEKGYIKLYIHDHEVYMPLGIIFIQVSQFAVAVTSWILFVEYLVLQVTYLCTSGVDCFLNNETNMSAKPLQCSDFENITEEGVGITCYHISFNPAIAAAVTGGFLKLVPRLLFSTLTFQYFKYLVRIKNMLKLSTDNNNIVVYVIVAIILEACFILVGVAALLPLIFSPNVPETVQFINNPLRRLTFIFMFFMYFAMAGFLWCLYPLQESTARFKDAVWKHNKLTPQKPTAADPSSAVGDSGVSREMDTLIGGAAESTTT